MELSERATSTGKPVVQEEILCLCNAYGVELTTKLLKSCLNKVQVQSEEVEQQQVAYLQEASQPQP